MVTAVAQLKGWLGCDDLMVGDLCLRKRFWWLMVVTWRQTVVVVLLSRLCGGR